MISYKEFEQLYREFYSSLLKVLVGITNSIEISEDLTQEAFVRLYNNLKIFPSPQDAKYWLIRVAKNLAFNYCKRKQNEVKAVKRLKQQPIAASTIDSDLVQKEDETLVRQALAKLPLKYRQVLLLKEYSNFSYAEIAKIEGISESNVKVRVFRARNLLEKIFNQEGSNVSK